MGAVHPKAKPVILTEPDDHETWLAAPWRRRRALQRPLPYVALRIVARGNGRMLKPDRSHLDCDHSPWPKDHPLERPIASLSTTKHLKYNHTHT